MDWNNEKDSLKKLILDEKKSYESIGRQYNCSGTNIKRVAKRLGIPLPRRRNINPNETFSKERILNKNYCLNCGNEIKLQNKYCNKSCELEYKHRLNYEDFLKHPEKYNRANYQPKAFKKDILKEQGNKCAICGCDPFWNNKPLVFVLDHIDGHASNNRRENLRMICPNCDSQTDTFKSKNKCGDRYYYRYHRSAPRETGDVENPLNDES